MLLLLKSLPHQLDIACLTILAHADRIGGGTGILARDSLVIKQARAGIFNSFEYSEYIIVSGSSRVRLVVIYRPPYSFNHPVTVNMFITEFADFLESVVMTI
jgi:hypothetical protein